MHQHVLRVAVAVLEHPQKLREFRVNAMDADLDEGALAGLLDRFLDLLLRLAHNLFDTSGWMRPSDINCSSETRAISRRIGLWHEMTTASGVSSMIMSTPVAASIARILRPSRPMMRPFISSLGNANTDTVRSATH